MAAFGFQADQRIRKGRRAIDYEKVEPSAFGAALRGFGVDALCRDVRSSAAFFES